MSQIDQTILSLGVTIEDERKEAITSGESKILILNGHISPSCHRPLLLHSDHWVVEVSVSEVRQVGISDLTPEEIENFGFRSKAELLLYLKELSPSNTGFRSDVTVIRWTSVRPVEIVG